MKRKQPKSARATWADYEALKSRWLASNPGAISQQLEQACRKIADRLGL